MSRHLLLIAMVNMITGCLGGTSGVNAGFCGNMTSSDATSGKTVPFPVLPGDFTMTYESISSKSKMVRLNTFIYSTTLQKIHMENFDSIMKIKTYIDAPLNQMISTTTNEHGTSCRAQLLNDSQELFYFHLDRTADGSVRLGHMEYPMLFYTTAGDPVYIGETKVRGIPANQWNVCLYSAWTNETTLASIYYSADHFNMSGSNGSSVPLKVEGSTHSEDTGEKYTFRFDFTEFNTEILRDDEIKSEIPEYSSCFPFQIPYANNLPKAPTSFTYKAEKVVQGGTGNKPAPSPVISHYEKTLSEPQGIFSMDKFEGVDNRTVNRRRLVQEFHSGLEYDLDLNNFGCDIRRIGLSKDHVEGIENEGAFMMSPGQFFDVLSMGYHYIGEHKYTDRGFPVDKWTKLKIPDDVMQTWSFASKNWMLNTMGFKDYHMIPVQFQIGETRVDFYAFSASPSDSLIHPDISSCFVQGKSIRVSMTLLASHKQIGSFISPHSAIREALVTSTAIKTGARVGQLKIIPNDTDTTIVSFLFLEARSMAGHGDEQSSGKKPTVSSAEQLYYELRNEVVMGDFVVNFNNGSTIHQVKASSIRTIDKMDFTNKTTDTRDSSSQSFSTASYIGSSVACFIFGVLSGIISFKLTKKLAKARNRTVRFQNLKESSVDME